MSHRFDNLPDLFNLPLKPNFSCELDLQKQGFFHIAGVDEVGRGPLAGPVVTAAVILDKDHVPDGLNDSKKLSAQRRNELYCEILQSALAVSIASLCARTIDQSDIRKATLEAMRRCVTGLAIPAHYALIDGRDIPFQLPCPATALIKGDQHSVSIAAASIIAKVTRDRMMKCAGQIYKNYGLEKHVGYATLAHRIALDKYGPVVGLHRYSFAPLKGRFRDNMS
ncbi:ribonuclease HII [Bartonella quintana]|uniref:Ribonuclease HII n=3 Tax=Bartonella quintana TaxID=803 RepID=RNH2_BARQU|nr:ribonuclease HII [Bartonella quintana]Q6G0E6.1 RecName: Full=Ribonuclease HII; Short=RNase HII [Bartonella quintana str. Toulouse]ETS11768.1 ribonuclease HII [Bartonella quintana BQ2-D70]ETS14571.1 ribonuclease HII [Bartonella quintana JK 73rel]ETS16258.1 ribonuclease HII [Bartonella quintana JK 73]ETS18261.1 ribonuclease HII [Bartonella quintana JK 7]ETS19090.1 ribonuclease HII [Bartonella quintana JK 12]